MNTIKLKAAGEEYNVKLEYPREQYDDLYKLMNLKLTGQNGRIVPLSDIAELKFEEASDEIMKRNGLYSLTITMLTSEDDRFRVQDEAQKVIKKMDRGGMTLGKDAIEEMEESEMRKMLMAILSSIFLVFLVMTMQFESPRFSAMVMMSIPFSFIGSIGLLFASGSSITMSAALGVLMLVGIVVNDGILFVDTTNSMKKHYPINVALARAGELRLRPILMTTLTTVLSMIPLVLSPDSGAEMMDGMGFIIIGGLSASTLLILFLLPTYYTMIMGKRAKLENLKMFPPEGQAAEDTKTKKHKKKHHKKSSKKKHHKEEAAPDEIPSVDDITDEKPEEEKPEIEAGSDEKPEEEKPAEEESSEEKPDDEKAPDDKDN
ncbi:MAG: efflux RND transporter permease subunit [Lachnospiraceae bacterium]|nr:efflux RND transporter permease subunit [Lachnospiraceae bacterium]